MNYCVLEVKKNLCELVKVFNDEIPFSRYTVLSLQPHFSYILKSQSVDDRLRRFPLSYYRTQ